MRFVFCFNQFKQSFLVVGAQKKSRNVIATTLLIFSDTLLCFKQIGTLAISIFLRKFSFAGSFLLHILLQERMLSENRGKCAKYDGSGQVGGCGQDS